MRVLASRVGRKQITKSDTAPPRRQVGVRLDPVGGLGLDGLGVHPPRPISEDLREDVLAGGQRHDVDPGGRLVHSGVLPGLVGQLV